MKNLFLTILITCLLLPLLGQEKSSIQEGIPNQVESMYLKGLQFLQKTQNPEGNWPNMYGDEAGVVGFALMAFLAHGDDANAGPYKESIKKCVDYILSKQNAHNGYIGTTMYTHGFATLALAEAYGMVHDDRIGPALQQAVTLILQAQETNNLGGWRYTPDSKESDTSICGCMMMALFAAKNAGINVPQATFDKAQKFMDSCRESNGAYGYTAPSGGRVTLSAIGSLVQSIGKLKKNEPYTKTLDFLKKNINYRDDVYMYYFEYYMAQALFHADESLWKEWNYKNINLLYATQRQDGSWNASAYATSLYLLSLAINYRFLPIYEK